MRWIVLGGIVDRDGAGACRGIHAEFDGGQERQCNEHRSGFHCLQGAEHLAGAFASAYAAVAQKLQDQNAIKTQAGVLFGQFERAQDPFRSAAFATAYAAVAGRWLEIDRGDREWEMQISRYILTMAGQPFLEDPKAPLAALESLAAPQFGDSIPVAVA